MRTRCPQAEPGVEHRGRKEPMHIGVVFPQTELPTDRGAVRAYVEGVEALGYSHLLAYDHVLGADTSVHPGWSGPYDLDSTFREPLVFFGHLAAFTTLE